MQKNSIFFAALIKRFGNFTQCAAVKLQSYRLGIPNLTGALGKSVSRSRYIIYIIICTRSGAVNRSRVIVAVERAKSDDNCISGRCVLQRNNSIGKRTVSISPQSFSAGRRSLYKRPGCDIHARTPLGTYKLRVRVVRCTRAYESHMLIARRPNGTL